MIVLYSRWFYVFLQRRSIATDNPETSYYIQRGRKNKRTCLTSFQSYCSFHMSSAFRGILAQHSESAESLGNPPALCMCAKIRVSSQMRPPSQTPLLYFQCLKIQKSIRQARSRVMDRVHGRRGVLQRCVQFSMLSRHDPSSKIDKPASELSIPKIATKTNLLNGPSCAAMAMTALRLAESSSGNSIPSIANSHNSNLKSSISPKLPRSTAESARSLKRSGLDARLPPRNGMAVTTRLMKPAPISIKSRRTMKPCGELKGVVHQPQY